MHTVFVLAFLASVQLSLVECQLAREGFVPYGTDAGDTRLTGDDEHSPPIDFTFRFYGTQYNQIYVSTQYFLT